jgi:glycosyltransferase involved in cell wall biosynthesis
MTRTINTKVSAILPNYNSIEFLPRAIHSLLDQKVPFDEIIIVDDGSTDESISLIEKFMTKHPQIYLIRHEKNQGVNSALNTGIKQARGDYVLLCAADDFYTSNIVSLSLPIMEKFPEVGVICGDAIVHRFDLKAPFYRMLPYPTHRLISREEFKSITTKSYVGFNSGGGMFINRTAILNAGLIKSEACWHGDWLLYFITAFRQGVYYINSVFIHINMRKSSYSEGKRNKKIQAEVMLNTIYILENEYFDLWPHFKDAALLPHYSMRYIILFLFDKRARRFFTLKLIWKLLVNNAMTVRIGRLFPYHIILSVRKLLRT